MKCEKQYRNSVLLLAQFSHDVLPTTLKELLLHGGRSQYLAGKQGASSISGCPLPEDFGFLPPSPVINRCNIVKMNAFISNLCTSSSLFSPSRSQIRQDCSEPSPLLPCLPQGPLRCCRMAHRDKDLPMLPSSFSLVGMWPGFGHGWASIC